MKIVCSTCDAKIKITKPELLGKKVVCPGCSGRVLVPEDLDLNSDETSQYKRISCKGCSTKLSIKPKLYGKTIKCPKCQRKMKVGFPKDYASDEIHSVNAETLPSYEKKGERLPSWVVDDSPREMSELEKRQLEKKNLEAKLLRGSREREMQSQPLVSCPTCNRNLRVTDPSISIYQCPFCRTEFEYISQKPVRMMPGGNTSSELSLEPYIRGRITERNPEQNLRRDNKPRQ
ncbi:MAG: hypothetical protein AB8B55_01120 [Mariniblastus sp.]